MEYLVDPNAVLASALDLWIWGYVLGTAMRVFLSPVKDQVE